MNRLLTIALVVFSSTFLLSCTDEPAKPVDNCGKPLAAGVVLEVISPKAGDVLTVGSTVTVKVTVDRDQIELLNAQVSVDEGKTYFQIPDGGGIPVPGSSGFQCTAYNWIIGTEGESVVYQNDNPQCKLRVSNYTDGTVFVESDFFRIKK